MRERYKRRLQAGKRRRHGNLVLGVVLLIVGSLLFAREFGVDLPDWIFRWEMILVIVGLSIGIKSQFRDFGWIAVTGVGLFFLSDDLFPNWNPSRFIVPAIVLSIGAFIILQRLSPGPREEKPDPLVGDGNEPGISRPQESTDDIAHANDQGLTPGITTREEQYFRQTQSPDTQPGYGNDRNTANDTYREPHESYNTDRRYNPDPAFGRQTAVPPVFMQEEELDVVSVFSAVNKKVFSKNFIGGEIVCVFGGSEINLMNADISQGTITLEVVCVFGGATLFIPPNWNVRSEMGSVFGGVDDKRKNAIPDPSRTLIINGVCIFGGLEIKTKF